MTKEQKIDELIGELKDKKVEPIPKWKAYFLRAEPWFLVFLVLIMAGLLFSFVLLPFANMNPQMMGVLGPGRMTRIAFSGFLNLISILFVGLLILGYLIFRKTETGYRYAIPLVLVVFLVLIGGIGFFMHKTKVNNRFELALERRGPSYVRNLFPRPEQQLFIPAEGMLAGRIADVSERSFTIFHRGEIRWTIFITSSTEIEQELDIKSGTPVMIFGEKEGENAFNAKIIRALEPLVGSGERLRELPR